MIQRLIIILPLLFLLSCTNGKHDNRLERIANTLSEKPHEALMSLDSVNPLTLSTSDRHYYDFLTVKAKDKAYIKHESDSLVIDLINYYSSSSRKELYPEILYYGGRVYSDLGDYPNALNYFHQSLDYLPPQTKDQNLRKQVLSQTGRLLTAMCLYDEAIPYIKSSLEIDRLQQDSVNLIFDLQLLGGTFLRAGQYQNAESCFIESLKISSNIENPLHISKSKMYLAAVKYKYGHLDAALNLIRSTPNSVNPKVRSSALGYAANIYLAAGILDTAFIYAKELISTPDSLHREIGYQVLLSPKLRNLLTRDSLDQYISDYRDVLESFYDENNSQLSINQQNLYNYQLHEKERIIAEQSNQSLRHWVVGFIVVLLTMGYVILFLKNRDKKHIIELRQAIENIERLEHRLNQSANDNESSVVNSEKSEPTKKTEKELRDELKQKLMSIYESSTAEYITPIIILQSEPYQSILELLRKGKTIKDNSNLWKDLEQVVLKCSPHFKTNLNLLTLGRLTLLDLHTALLIKCGLKPSQMKTLLGISNGGIISRRETLCFKVLDEKMSVKVIDSIIRLL